MKVTKTILNIGKYNEVIELTQEMIDKMKPGDRIESGIEYDEYAGHQLCDCHNPEDLYYFRLTRFEEETEKEMELRKKNGKK